MGAKSKKVEDSRLKLWYTGIEKNKDGVVIINNRSLRDRWLIAKGDKIKLV